MANDISKALSSNPIKNGTMIVSCKPTGPTSNDVNDRYAKNTPSLSDIQNKYDNRFDNPSYYYGGGNTDGGDVI